MRRRAESMDGEVRRREVWQGVGGRGAVAGRRVDSACVAKCPRAFRHGSATQGHASQSRRSNT